MRVGDVNEVERADGDDEDIVNSQSSSSYSLPFVEESFFILASIYRGECNCCLKLSACVQFMMTQR